MSVAMRYGSNEYTRSRGASGGGSSGGITMSLLWTNPSPTSSFAAQTVLVDTTEYDMAVVFCRTFATTDSNTSVMSSFVLKDVKCAIQIQSPASSNAGIRRVTMTNTGFEFMQGSYNGSTNNNNGVPLYIYGVKGIT